MKKLMFHGPRILSFFVSIEKLKLSCTLTEALKISVERLNLIKLFKIVIFTGFNQVSK